MGLSKSASSRIPVISPINNGVNVEDFRLAVIRGSTEAAKKYINQGLLLYTPGLLFSSLGCQWVGVGNAHKTKHNYHMS